MSAASDSDAMAPWVDLWDKEGNLATDEQVDDLIRMLKGTASLTVEECQMLHLPEPLFKNVLLPERENDDVWPSDLLDRFIKHHGENYARPLVEEARTYPIKGHHHGQNLEGYDRAAEDITHRDIASFQSQDFKDVEIGITDDDKAYNDLASRLKLWTAQQDRFGELMDLSDDEPVARITAATPSVPHNLAIAAVTADVDQAPKPSAINNADADVAHAEYIELSKENVAVHEMERSDEPANKRLLPRVKGPQTARLTPAQQSKRAAAQRKKKKKNEEEGARVNEKQFQDAAEQRSSSFDRSLYFTDLRTLQTHPEANLKSLVEKVIKKAELIDQRNPKTHEHIHRTATDEDLGSPGKPWEIIDFKNEEAKELGKELDQVGLTGSTIPDSTVKSMFKKAKSAL